MKHPGSCHFSFSFASTTATSVSGREQRYVLVWREQSASDGLVRNLVENELECRRMRHTETSPFLFIS